VIFVPDTNVWSEAIKQSPDASVVKFFRGVKPENLRLSAIVLGEIAQGVENNPTPGLRAFLADMLAWPLIDFGEAEALKWGQITSAALQAGYCVKVRDSLIAASAAVRGWTVATRNTDDFKPLGVAVFDPWTEKL
jgi:toxin FitB